MVNLKKSYPSTFNQLFLISIIILGLFTFVSCATTLSSTAIKIKEADIKTVENCKYLGEVHGSSGWGNLGASVAMQNAKNEALEKAAKLGATHVIWNNITGGYSPYVSGKAYYCKSGVSH